LALKSKICLKDEKAGLESIAITGDKMTKTCYVSSNQIDGDNEVINALPKLKNCLREKPWNTVIPRLSWWMISGSNWKDFFRRNAVSVEKKGVGIV